MAVTYSSWEDKNQSRRYPLDEQEGDVAPFGYLVDMNIVIAEYIDKAIYVSAVIVSNGNLGITISNTNGVIAWGHGKSEDLVEFTAIQGVTGSCVLGSFDTSTSINMRFSLSNGAVHPSCITVLPGSGTRIEVDGTYLTGSVSLLVSGITLSNREFDVSGIYINNDVNSNRLALPDCAVSPEEYWARSGRQGILSINGVYADNNGDLLLSVNGKAAFSVTSGNFYSSLSTDRADMCSAENWHPPVIVSKCKEPDCV